ncbi:MAG: DNA-3-methyladenine glycosylase 2 family protein, partial [Bacteroidota bacterium]
MIGNRKIVNEEDCKALILQDDIFSMIVDTYGYPPNWSRPPGFASLSLIILEQQVSLASAKAHFDKLHSYIGDFTPENILTLDDQEMRICQISRQKTKYLRALSSAVLSGELNLEKLSSQSESFIRQQLTTIKGIGQWTSEVYLMFCLQSKDIFPIGDIALVNTVRELTNAHTKEEILEVAAKWTPLRTLASYFLWF